MLRITRSGRGEVLLATHLSVATLHALASAHLDLTARVLVFPNHGGLLFSRGNLFQFAKVLCDLVQPERIVFSIGRGRFEIDRYSEAVSGAVSASPGVHIACTGLSIHCAQVSSNGEYCAGTTVLSYANGTAAIQPSAESHAHFIEAHAPSALCYQEYHQVRTTDDPWIPVRSPTARTDSDRYADRRHRVLVEIVEVRNDGDRMTLTVIIPAWSPTRPVPIDAAALDPSLANEDPVSIVGRRYFAEVNVWVERPRDLVIENVVPAAVPPDDFMTWTT